MEKLACCDNPILPRDYNTDYSTCDNAEQVTREGQTYWASRYVEFRECGNCGSRETGPAGTAYWTAESWEAAEPPDFVEHDEE